MTPIPSSNGTVVNGAQRRTDEDRRRQYIEKRKRSRFKAKSGLVAELYKTQFFKLTRKWSAKQVEILDLSSQRHQAPILGAGHADTGF